MAFKCKDLRNSTLCFVIINDVWSNMACVFDANLTRK